MAVLTLPQEVLGLYKPHIHYISEHAVDPDKRRYALKNEAFRHYIDLDHWDTIPFLNVPRDLDEAIIKEGVLWGLSSSGDSIVLNKHVKDLDSFYIDIIGPDRYSPIIELSKEESEKYLQNIEGVTEIQFFNQFVGYGVLPYFLEDFYYVLVKCFESGDVEKILKISADIGHYIADAHVPLHTTENYNGQMTDQLGIHAFWESRLPELFAEQEYDMVVGKAEYIEDKKAYFWGIILDSHALLAEVLSDEWDLRQNFPSDRQFCFDNRSDRTVRIQCPEYAEAYHKAMDGMVEDRMQAAILSVGSVWYSAWIDAGQPDLRLLDDNVDVEKIRQEMEALDAARQKNDIYGRNHGF